MRPSPQRAKRGRQPLQGRVQGPRLRGLGDDHLHREGQTHGAGRRGPADVGHHRLGLLVEADDARVEAGRQVEEDRVHQDAHRVRIDALRDPDGRHQVQAVQVEQGHGGRRDSS